MKYKKQDFERGEPADVANINGWGVDADTENDPTYPMKKRTNAEHKGYVWERPPQQESDVEVLHSNERPNLTAVYGTAVPPSGLSGAIRRRAFRHSESSIFHWMPLILADRINMLEGVVSDLSHGKPTNFWGEMGWRASWKHDRKRMVIKCGVGVTLLALACAYRRRRR